MKRAYADITEGQVHYMTEGSGEAFLLLHESPHNWSAYAQMIPLLAKTHRVIAMDTLGFGNSDPPPRDFQIGDYAESVAHFLDSLNIGSAYVMGDRTGACISVELAVRWPERVKGLVLNGLPFWTSWEERLARLEQIKGRDWEAQEVDGSHCTRIWQHFLETMPGGKEGNISEGDLEILARTTLDVLKAGPRWKAVDIGVFSYDPEPRLPLVKAPTLVMGVTSEGANWYTKRPNEVSALIPRSEVSIIEGGDMRVKIIRAGEVVEIIRRFFESHTP